MSEFKMIQESDFGDIGEIFQLFFRDVKTGEYTTEICKITKKEAKQGTNKIIRKIEIKIPPRVRNNDMIILKEQGNDKRDVLIKIHIYGSKSKRKGKIIYEN